MATTESKIASFDVTCKIGTVEVGRGGEPAHIAAIKMIAEHDAAGVFTFEIPDGRTYTVTIEFEEWRPF